jgi:hypothetical protein
MSQHHRFTNAFYEVKFGLHSDTGIHGACPIDMLLQFGLISSGSGLFLCTSWEAQTRPKLRRPYHGIQWCTPVGVTCPRQVLKGITGGCWTMKLTIDLVLKKVLLKKSVLCSYYLGLFW